MSAFAKAMDRFMTGASRYNGKHTTDTQQNVNGIFRRQALSVVRLPCANGLSDQIRRDPRREALQ
jgi:hypothetical protein